MSTTPTPNYGWLLPVPGTEIDTWAPIVNTVFEAIDAQLVQQGVAPDRFMAQSVSGETLVSDPVRTPTACNIARIYKTSAATTITIETIGEHGYTTGDDIVVRVGGRHGTSWRRHPANGTWDITVASDTTFVLSTRLVEEQGEAAGQPSKWAQGGHKFVDNGAICYENGTKINARLEWTRLEIWLTENGGGTLTAAPGIYIFTGQDSRASFIIRIASNMHIRLDGVTLFRDDYNDGGHFVYFGHISGGTGKEVIDGSDSFSITGGVVNGNRQYQTTDRGFHNFRGYRNRHVRILDTWCVNSAGYGVGLQGDDLTYFDDVELRMTLWDSDSDGIDIKNRGDANEGLKLDIRVYGFACGNIGTHMANRLLANNAFSTTIGSSIVRTTALGSTGGSAIRNRPLPNTPVTFYGATDTGGVVLNGTFMCTTIIDSNVFEFDAITVASSTATGGGAAAYMDAPTNSPNDAGVDIRGHAHGTAFVRAEFLGSAAGFRARAGATGEGTEQHSGARYSNFANVWVENTYPVLADPTSNPIGIDIDAESVNATNLISRKFRTGLVMGPQSSYTNVGHFIGYRSEIGARVSSETQGTLHDSALVDCGTGVYVAGSVVTSGITIVNAFDTVNGSPIITVNFVSAFEPIFVGADVLFYNGSGGTTTAGGSGDFGLLVFRVVGIPVENAQFTINLSQHGVSFPTSTLTGTGGTRVLVYPKSQVSAVYNKLFNVRTFQTCTLDFDMENTAFDTQIINSNVNISTGTGSATGVLTVTVNPVAGETVTVGNQFIAGSATLVPHAYTFRATLDNAVINEVLIGATLAKSLENLARAINGGGGAGIYFSIATKANEDVRAVAAATTVTVTSRFGGTDANAIATSEGLASGAWGGATLTGGGVAVPYSDSGVRTNWRDNIGGGVPTQNIVTHSIDVDLTVTDPTDMVRLTGTITAARAVTLSASLATWRKRRFRRTGAGAFNWSIGGLTNLAVNEWCEVEYTGSVWEVTARGSL